MAGQPEALVLAADGQVPNSRLPVLIYRQGGPAAADAMLGLFAKSEWTNGWRNGIYTFHHFHSIAHEVLGITRGKATVRLGGETGHDISLRAGDVVVLPAGTGHKRLNASSDFEVVGSYPGGCDWDLIRADEVTPEVRARAEQSIASVPLPRTDPVHGAEGPLTRLWRA